MIIEVRVMAKEGNSKVNAVSGLNLRVNAKIAPPIPESPADRNALVRWTLSTLIPLLAMDPSAEDLVLNYPPVRAKLFTTARQAKEQCQIEVTDVGSICGLCGAFHDL